jgi:adenine-specific DNA-methyltransferase
MIKKIAEKRLNRWCEGKKLEDKDREYVFVFGEVANRRVAIVWRSIKDMDFKEDKKIIEGSIKEFNPDEIYVNGDCAVRNFR